MTRLKWIVKSVKTEETTTTVEFKRVNNLTTEEIEQRMISNIKKREEKANDDYNKLLYR